MTVIGSAYVEIHTITDKVAGEVRDGLSRAIQGTGTESGKTFGDEFGKESSSRITTSTEQTSQKVTETWSQAGTTAGRGFSDKFSSIIQGALRSSLPAPSLDTSKLEADIAKVERQLTDLRNKKTTANVDADIAVAQGKLTQVEAKLADLNNQEANPEVELEIAKAEADAAKIRGRLAALGAEKANPRVDIDIAAAESRLAALQAQLTALGAQRVNTRVDIDTNGASSGLSSLSGSLGMVSGRVAAMVGGVVAVTPSLASLGAAAVAAAGALNLIPAALAAIGLGVGTAMAGLSGVGEAFKTLGAAEKAGAATSQAAAGQRAAAAKTIESAQKRLSDAVRTSDRAQVSGAQQVADARDSLAQAESNAADRIANAQDALSSAVDAAAQSQIQSARRIAAAEQAVEDARINGAERVADAQDALSDAVEAAARQQQQSARTIADSEDRLAEVRVQAAESVEEAQQQLTDTIAQAQRTQAQASDRLLSAQNSLTRAQEAAREAQEGLTQAYADANEQAQQLGFSVRDAALGQEEAVDRLEEAQQRLLDARAEGAGAEELDDLDRAVRQAQLSLDEAGDRYADLQKKAEEAAKAGVEGSDEVVGAQKNVKNATDAVAEAEKGVQQARDDAAQAATDSAREIADARKNLEKAQVNGAKNIAAAERDVSDARAEAAQAAEDSAERVTAANKNVAKAQADAARSVQDAEQNLADAREQASADAVAAAKNVEKAQAALNKAQTDGAADVAKAQEALSRAIASSNQQNEDAARAVAEAQQALAEATSSAAGQSSAASLAAAAAMAALSPAARDLVTQIRSLGPAWDAMKLDVQERMFQNVGAAIGLLGRNYIPILGGALGTVADGYNRAMLAALAFLNTGEAQASMKTGLDNTAVATSTLSQALVPVVKGFTDLFAVGSAYLPGFAQGILNAANGWATYISNARASGELNAIIDRAIIVFQQLWGIIQNVGSILGTVFDAGVASGSNFLGTMLTVTSEIDKFLKTGEGNAALVILFTSIGEVVHGLLPGILAIGAALANGVVAVGPQLGPLAESFSAVAIAVAPLITDLLKLVAIVLPPLTSLITTLAPALGPLAAAFVALMVVNQVMGAFNAAKTAMYAFSLAQGTVTTLSAASTPVMTLLGAAVRALGLAFAANPIGIIVVALAALAAGVIYAYNHFEGFRNVVDGVFSWITGAVSAVVNFFTTTFVDGIGGGIQSVIKFFQDLPGNAANFVSELPNRIAYALGSLAGTLVKLAVDGWNGFQEGAISAWNNTIAWVQALPGNLAKFFTSLPGVLLSSGTDALTGLRDGFIRGFANVIVWLVGLPGQIGAFFTQLPGSMLQFGIDILTGLVNGLVSGARAVYDFFAGLVDNFLQGFRDALGIASPSTLFMQFGIWILEGLINGIKALATGVVTAIKAVGQTIIDGFLGFVDGIKTLWDNFWAGLNSITGGAFDGIRVLIESVIGVIVTIFQTFIALVTGDWDTFWTNISGLAEDFLGGLQVIWDTVWGAIRDTATAIWDFISSYFDAALSEYKALWDSVWNAVSAAFSVVWNAIKTAAETIWNALKAFWDAELNGFKALWDTIWNAISAAFSVVWGAIQTAAEAIWNALKAFWDSGFSDFQALWDSVWNAVSTLFSTVWGAIQSAGETIWNAISKFFTDGLNAYKTLWETIWNAVSKAFTDIWNSIKEIANTVWTAIQAFFTAGLNDFKTRWDTFWGSIKTAFSTLWEGIKSVAQAAWEGIQTMFKGGINLVIDAVNWPIDKINGALGISIPTIPRLATGGDIHAGEGRVGGLAGRTADRTPALLSAEEHVWSGKEVMGVGGHEGVRKLRKMAREGLLNGFADGGHVDSKNIPPFQPGAYIVNDKIAGIAGNFLDALNRGQPEAVQATGGRYATGPTRHALGGSIAIPGFAAGGALVAAQQFAQAQNGKPYIWGGVGPAGYDCSGFQSAITNVLRGKNPYSRLGNTDSMPWSGFTSGLTSSYTVGRALGNPGHTAGTLGGVNVEAGGSPSMTKYGTNAAGSGSGQFPDKFSLPEVGGAYVDGGAGGLFDPAAMFDAAAKLFNLPEASRQFTRDVMPNAPQWMEPMGVSFHDKGWDGMRDAAIAMLTQISTLGGLLGNSGSPVATGPVQDQVRAIAAQYGWDQGAEWDALSAIIQKESSWNPNAANPNSSAKGLFQKMTSLHGPVESTAGGQAQWGLNYIKDRYGDPIAALAHHNQVGSYDTGGWLKPGITQAINGTGKPEAIIADPMTTFEKSFKNVFKWFAPECRDAIENSWRGASDWIRDLIERLSPRDKPSTETPHTPPVVVPPVIVPPVEVPPVVVPEIPTGELGLSFQDALEKFAPDLSVALQTGSGSQISEVARSIQENDTRMAAISEAMGVPLENLNGILGDLATSVAPIVQNPVVTAPSQDPLKGLLDSAIGNLFQFGQNIDKGRHDERYRYSEDQQLWGIARKSGQSYEDFRKDNPLMNTQTDPIREMEIEMQQRFSKIPGLAKDFNQAFPDIVKSLQSSAPDLQKVMSNRAGDILDYISKLSEGDASALLTALGATTPANVLSEAQQSVASSTSSTSAPTLTVSEGAVQLNINGNADSATIDQINAVLQSTLTEWSDEIMRQYEGRK